MSDILNYVTVDSHENIKKLKLKFPHLMFYCYDNGDFKFYIIYDGWSVKNLPQDLDVYYGNKLTVADLEDYSKLYRELAFLELRNKISTLIFKTSYTGKLIYSKLLEALLGE